MEKVDLRFYPFRGILKEMSEELNLPVDRIHKALFRNKCPNPDMAELFEQKLDERKKKVRKFKRSIQQAS